MKQDLEMKMMLMSVFLLFFLLTSLGCESIALMPRPALDHRADISRRDLDRGPESRAELPRQRATDEVTGTVQKVDQNRQEIQLRTTEGRMIVIKYDPATAVYSREREIPVDSLRYGDLILVKVVKNTQGEQYADLIRLGS
jgi:hypothetical protein